MSKDTGSGSGLLSKVVKFVTSPTTHWSDLDRSTSSDDNSESRLALKEMVERKRRNDFVRNRELDMLRKLRRREHVRGDEIASAGVSFFPSSQSPKAGERARTLEKIDEIEAQMATSWFKRKGSDAAADAPPTRLAPQARQPVAHAPGASDMAYAKTAPAPLSLHEPMRAPPVRDLPPLAFEPTSIMSAEGRQANAPAPAAPAPAPVHQPVVAFAGLDEFNVEVLIEARQDPEIEVAAILFANGDAAGAEAGLLELLREGGSRQDDLDTWLTLFDLYRASGEQTKFDDAALGFAARFGRSAPQWAQITERASVPAPMQPAATLASTSGLFHWVCPSVMGTQTVATLKIAMARQAPPWRIDWRHVKTIEPAALPGLIEALRHWADTPVRVKFLGVEKLLALLTEQSPTGDRSVDPRWWDARLALLRVMSEIDEFEVVALNYCVTYEVSPPAWEDPLSSYSPMTEDGQTVLPSSFGDDVQDTATTDGFAATEPYAGTFQPSEYGVLKGELSGELVGSAEQALQSLSTSGTAVAYEINCRHLLRVDFGAAGDLLNWTMMEQGQGKAITFRQVNRLVAAFFGVVGINGSARILLRVD